jgi:hypothetical protein
MNKTDKTMKMEEKSKRDKEVGEERKNERTLHIDENKRKETGVPRFCVVTKCLILAPSSNDIFPIFVLRFDNMTLT